MDEEQLVECFVCKKLIKSKSILIHIARKNCKDDYPDNLLNQLKEIAKIRKIAKYSYRSKIEKVIATNRVLNFHFVEFLRIELGNVDWNIINPSCKNKHFESIIVCCGFFIYTQAVM